MEATPTHADQSRDVRTLMAWAIAVTVAAALVSFYLLQAPLFRADIRFTGPALMLGVALVSAVLMRFGWVTRAVDVLAFGVGLTTGIIALLSGGVRSPVIPIYPGLILLYGWLRNDLAGPLMAVFCMVSLMLLWLIGVPDFVPAQLDSPASVYVVNTGVVCLLSGVAVVMIRRIYRRQIRELDQLDGELAGYADLLEQSEARYRTLIERMPEAILVHRNTQIVYANPAALHLFGAPDLATLMLKRTTDLICPDQLEAQLHRMQQIINGEDHPPVARSCFVRLDGIPVPVEVQGTAIDFDGAPAIHVSIRDITERQRLEDEIRQLAFYDTLTSLPNRRLLDDRLVQTLAASQRSGSFGALLFLDLDNFKPLNDRYGHLVGDQLLLQAGARLKSCVRAKDTVARYGGDEFVVLLPELDTNASNAEQAALQVAHKILLVMTTPYPLGHLLDAHGQPVPDHPCSVSIGLVVFAPEQASANDLLERADATMYQAKQAGRNRVVLWQPAPACPK